MTLEFLFYLNFYKAPQGWIRTAAAPPSRDMPSHWFGGVLSRHCPEVKREISIFTVFEEPCF